MKFENVLNAYVKAAIELSQLDPIFSDFYIRKRQAAKFRSWLLEHQRPACQAKRLEWATMENDNRCKAETPVGYYEIFEYNTINGDEYEWVNEVLDCGGIVSTRSAAEAACQAHFDKIWHEMTDTNCNDDT